MRIRRSSLFCASESNALSSYTASTVASEADEKAGTQRAPRAPAPGVYECEAFRLFPRLCSPPRVAAHAKVLVGAEEVDSQKEH